MDLSVIGLTNLALCIGFVYIAYALLPRFMITNAFAKGSGVLFFVIGAALRIPIVFDSFFGTGGSFNLTSGYAAVLQLIMAFAVWIFIYGLHRQKKQETAVEFVSEGMAQLQAEVTKLQTELSKKDNELNTYQKERFTRSLSEMQSRVEELKNIVIDTEGRF